MTHFYSLISPTLYLQFLVEGNMVFGVEKNNNKENKKESHSKYNGKQPKFELTSVSAAQGKNCPRIRILCHPVPVSLSSFAYSGDGKGASGLRVS